MSTVRTLQQIYDKCGLLDKPPSLVKCWEVAKLKRWLEEAYHFGVNAGLEQGKQDHLKDLSDAG